MCSLFPFFLFSSNKISELVCLMLKTKRVDGAYVNIKIYSQHMWQIRISIFENKICISIWNCWFVGDSQFVIETKRVEEAEERKEECLRRIIVYETRVLYYSIVMLTFVFHCLFFFFFSKACFPAPGVAGVSIFEIIIFFCFFHFQRHK